MTGFMFTESPEVDEGSWAKAMKAPAAVAMLDAAVDAYASCDWSAEALHDVTDVIGQQQGLKLGKAQAPIRVAVTGRTVGPPLFESLELLGRESVLERLRAARQRLG